MMREQPLLVVLDEPTAALDAHAEHALFERYAASTRAAATAAGAITLFVSHRFSLAAGLRLPLTDPSGPAGRITGKRLEGGTMRTVLLLLLLAAIAAPPV